MCTKGCSLDPSYVQQLMGAERERWHGWACISREEEALCLHWSLKLDGLQEMERFGPRD